MKHLRLSGPLRYAAVLALLCIGFIANSQTHTPRYNSIDGNCGGYYEYLPQGYSTSGQNYPLIVYMHGIGETGNGTTDLGKIINSWTPLPRVIENGAFPTSFNVGGQSFSFIVISPQFKGWPTASDVNDVVNYAIQNYRVDQSRIYITGMSMGGGAVWDFAAAYPNKAAAIVPVCGASTPDGTRAQAIANAKLSVWATHNQNDYTVPSSNTTGWVSLINQYGGSAISTIWPYTGHDAWSTTYDPNFTQNGVNIYQWMLQHQRGGSSTSTPPPATNQLPTVNAGASQTITLPTSSASLSGTGSDPDGSITSFQWSQVSGPSQASFLSTSWANTSVSGLLQGTYVFALKVTDNAGGTATSNVTITVNGAASSGGSTSGSTTTSSRIEAENYSNMSGVQTENTQDAGGGKDVGWIDNGDWMDYSVSAASAGSYTVNLRIAAPFSGSQLQIKNSAGSVLATVNVPYTGGFQTWQTVSANITLAAGTQTIRVQSTSNAGFNFNWMDIAGASGSTTGSTTGGSTTTTSSRIEAENYSNMSGIQTENTQDAGGGKDVGWIDNGDWMDYSVSAASAGSYTVNLRIAAPFSGSQLQIKNSAGSVLATVNVPYTGGFQTWQTVSANITLAAGTQTIRVQSTSNAGFNFNWMDIAGASGSTTGSTTGGSTTTTSSRIEAENYSNMSGIQTENTQDAGGGKDVGWIDNGDWMDYSVSAASAGSYTVNLRIAAPFSGSQLQIKNSAGSVLATVNVPYTGGFQTWQTVSANVTLAAGTQTIRVQSTSNASFNFNWLEIAGGTASAAVSKTSSTELVATPTASSEMSIYPNPVKDKFQLQINNSLTGKVTVQIYDMQGSLQKTLSLNKTDVGSVQFYLSIGELASANYIIKATMTGWSQSKEIIKQ